MRVYKTAFTKEEYENTHMKSHRVTTALIAMLWGIELEINGIKYVTFETEGDGIRVAQVLPKQEDGTDNLILGLDMTVEELSCLVMTVPDEKWKELEFKISSSIVLTNWNSRKQRTKVSE